MLTPTDFQNIKNFDNLRYSHQKVFRHRVKRKCRNALKDIKYILLNYKKLKIMYPEKVIELNDVIDILQIYEELKKIHTKV